MTHHPAAQDRKGAGRCMSLQQSRSYHQLPPSLTVQVSCPGGISRGQGEPLLMQFKHCHHKLSLPQLGVMVNLLTGMIPVFND
jgi:hypothetical protein